MAYSSYQVERVIERLRQLRDWLPWPAHRRWRGEDPVRVSAAARRAADAAREERGAGPVPPPAVEAVRERHRYPPAVERERERRAGSFMEPPYPDEPLPPIPRRGHWQPRRRTARPLTEGD